MLNKFFYVPVIITLILMLIGYRTYVNEVQRIKQSAQENVILRHHLISQYTDLLSVTNTKLSQSIVNAYRDVIAGHDDSINVFDGLSYFKSLDMYGISELSPSKFAQQLSGTLVVSAQSHTKKADLNDEISAISLTDNEFALLTGETGLVDRVYYTSVQGFVYITPKVAIENWHFFPEFYQKKFWQEVIATSNTSAKQIITTNYDDNDSRGLILTISTPIMINDLFLGVLSIDIKLDYLVFLLDFAEVDGVSFLVDENQQLVVANSAISGISTIPRLMDKAQWSEIDGGEIYSAPVLSEQLYMLHYINNFEIQQHALKASLVMWLLLLIVLILSCFIIFICKVRSKNNALMIIDPLTKLYNRHGFYTLLKPIYSGLLRTPNAFALLMVDIDNLQHFNEQYGHLTGDKMIMLIAKKIIKTNRKSSICCRWRGGEFLIFCQGISAEAAETLARRINSEVAKKKKGNMLHITVSVGVYVTRATDDLETMIKFTENALSQAKELGKNQVYISNAL